MDKEEIRKLYSSALPEIDRIIIETPRYVEQKEKANKIEDEMRDFIGKDGYRKFEKFMDEYLYLVHLDNEECFVQGFSIANRLRDESLIK